MERHGDRKGTMDIPSLRQMGILILLVFLPLALGVRYGILKRPSPLGMALEGKRTIHIEVKGAVERPGLFAYTHPPTLDYLLRDAGGRSSPLYGEGETVSPPFQQDLAVSFFFDEKGLLRYRTESLSVKALWILGRPLPLNRATAEELALLPGIGPVLAQRIVAFRKAVGGFTSLDQLMEVKGIKEKTFEIIKSYLTI